MTSVSASAPARVDLAGGTLDLWPLYLLHEGSQTVNFAIDRRARAVVTRLESGFELVSQDLGFEGRYRDAAAACAEPRARLAAEAAGALGLPSGVRIELASFVPFGSGLGGSSALLVALVLALTKITGAERDRESVVALCRDLETRLLGFPAGTQDYESALRGGFNVLSFGPGGVSARTERMDPELFSRHLVLFDSGQSHASGANNWEVYRRRIGGEEGTREALDAVRDAAGAMARASQQWDFEEMGRALRREWAARQRLFPGASTPLIDEAERRALRAGAWGLKACGAGGGGVVAILAPEKRRAAVVEALEAIGKGSLFRARPENEGARLD